MQPARRLWVEEWGAVPLFVVPATTHAPGAWPEPAWMAAWRRGMSHPLAGRALRLAGALVVTLLVFTAIARIADRGIAPEAGIDRLPLAVRLEPIAVPRPVAGGAGQVAPARRPDAEPAATVDVSRVTTVSRVEWRVVQMTVPDRSAPAAIPGAAPGAGLGGAGSGSGVGRGSGSAFDPYAGASPQRRAGAGAGTAAAGYDRAALDAALSGVRARFRGLRQPVALRIRLSPSGQVLDVALLGRADARLEQAVRDALIGRRLAERMGAIGGAAEEVVVPDALTAGAAARQ